MWSGEDAILSMMGVVGTSALWIQLGQVFTRVLTHILGSAAGNIARLQCTATSTWLFPNSPSPKKGAVTAITPNCIVREEMQTLRKSCGGFLFHSQQSELEPSCLFLFCQSNIHLWRTSRRLLFCATSCELEATEDEVGATKRPESPTPLSTNLECW